MMTLLSPLCDSWAPEQPVSIALTWGNGMESHALPFEAESISEGGKERFVLLVGSTLK